MGKKNKFVCCLLRLVDVDRFLFWLTGFLPVKPIFDDGQPYLERYHLFCFRGKHYYLHLFAGSDRGRGLHNHPWPASSLILWGKYRETRMVDAYYSVAGIKTRVAYRFYYPGDVNIIRPSDFHKVELVSSHVWTLFAHGPRRQGWGFVEVDQMAIGEYTPYANSADDHPDRDWWKDAPKGRDFRRDSAMAYSV